MQLRRSPLLLVSVLGIAGGNLTACSDEAGDDANGGGSGGSGATGVGGTGASAFNQCGVAAPLPAESGQCTLVSAPLITDFDDYSGTDASSYTFSVGAAPPAPAVLGAILHVGDGSDTSPGTGVITTEMVTGEGDTGYALSIANPIASNWGGLLSFYFPFSGTTAACLDAREHGGLAFSIKGSSPSGRFGVNVSMLDTVPPSDHGLCSNPASSDCKDANVELLLPPDAETWKDVQLPWSAFTPGVGSATSCIPVTGQNIVRIVIQPFMNYPPPNYTFEPGAYSIAVDNLRFY